MTPILPDPEPLGIPVPMSILLILKVFGFWLHLVFMSLWLAGMPVALVLWKRRPVLAERLFSAMPFFLAFGINAGIVPLLFVQALYPQFFYTATILQAWFWLLIIPLVLVAYTAAYFAAAGRFRVWAALVASLLFLEIGYTFAATFHTLSEPRLWPAIFRSTVTAGAVSGLYLNVGEIPLLRLGLVIGMALGSVAAYLALDLNVIRPDPGQAHASRRLVPILYGLGMVVYGFVALRYVAHITGYISADLRALTGIAMVLAMGAAVVYGWRPGRLWSTVLTGMHAGVLLINAVGRQVVQSRSLEEWLEPGALRVQSEWGGFLLFVAVGLVGIAVLVWMIRLYGRYRMGTG